MWIMFGDTTQKDYYADKTVNVECGYCRTYCISFYASTLVIIAASC